MNEDLKEFFRTWKPPKFMEWWIVQNTGWSDGTSWFQSGGSEMNPYRAESEQEAIDYINERRKDWDDPAVKWRYVHVTIEREDNKAVTTEIWTEI